MDNPQFEDLLESVRDMGRHMRGAVVPEARGRELREPDVAAIRERTGLNWLRYATRPITSSSPAYLLSTPDSTEDNG
ncbi:hypothetical protein [uncultured Thiodictyon sp.]|uniref:hypothetical protein n=1 Tax=uncultured Thiodictyon sp. TaxID=1846217 RepID=UPI0025CD6FAB|nr:hypothetical protein [uncultured Thiodictyon sp.]